MSFSSMHDDYLDPDKHLLGAEYCEVCGRNTDDCACPECPACGATGDPKCYSKHGLAMTPAQLRAAMESLDRAEAEQDADPGPDDFGPYDPGEEHVRPIKVHCAKCGLVNEAATRFVNIEEGPQGEDVLTFVCPCGLQGKSKRLG